MYQVKLFSRQRFCIDWYMDQSYCLYLVSKYFGTYTGTWIEERDERQRCIDYAIRQEILFHDIIRYLYILMHLVLVI